MPEVPVFHQEKGALFFTSLILYYGAIKHPVPAYVILDEEPAVKKAIHMMSLTKPNPTTAGEMRVLALWDREQNGKT